MEAVGRLASEVAGTCEKLLRDVYRDAQRLLTMITDAPQRSEALLEEVTRVGSFLHQLVAYGHEQAAALAPVDVNRILRDVEPVLRQVAGDAVTLELRKAASPVHVDVNAERVERLLVNVASYGRERMPHGGRLRIELSTVVVDGKFTAQHPNVRLGPHAIRLRVTRTAIGLDLAGASVDVLEFDAAVRRGDERSLGEAVALHTAPILAGWTQEWVFERRHARERACTAALVRLVGLLLARNAPAAALPHLERLVEEEPFDEDAPRQLMRVHAAAGRYLAAMRTYQSLRARVDKGLGAEPSPAVRALYASIRREARAAAALPAPAVDAAPSESIAPASRVTQVDRVVRLEGILTAGDQRKAVTLEVTAIPGLPDTGWHLELRSVDSEDR